MPADTSEEALSKVTEELSNLPSISERQIDLSHSVKLPFDAIPALGTAFASLPETFRTVTTTVATQSQGGEALFRLTDAAGNIITPDMLQRFKDGSGMLGSTRVNNTFAQARLHVAEAATTTQTVTSVIPFDPTTMFLAAALMQINSKLDSIASLQKEMLAYAKLRDHAKLIGACRVIDEVKAKYRFNSDNQQFLLTCGVAIAQAKRDALDAIARQHDLLAAKLGRLKAIHTSAEVKKKTDEILELLKDFQLATYVYEYATVLDVVLVGNYSADYLADVIHEMKQHAQQYADMYHKCLGIIRQDASDALGSRVLRGLGAASGAASNLVASTVIGGLTPIDEAMRAGAGAFYSKSKEGVRRGKAAMSMAKPGFTQPFIDSVRSISSVHNDPVLIAIGTDSVYVIPADALHANNRKRETPVAARRHVGSMDVASDIASQFAAGPNTVGSNELPEAQKTRPEPSLEQEESPFTSSVPRPEALRPYLDDHGRLQDLPKEPNSRLIAIWYLAANLINKRFYTEQELCRTIDRWLISGDHATARRELVITGLLYRIPDGSSFGFADNMPSLDAFLTSRVWKRKRR